MKMSSIVVFAIVLAIAGCSSNSTISDIATKPTINILNKSELAPDQIIFRNSYDNMDRGNHDLANESVVDLKYYDRHPINRGDIVYYQPPDELKERMGDYDISRVIGLPGEKVKIEKGQVYINGMLLNAFYGRAHRLGFDLIGLKKALERSDLEERIRKNIENQVSIMQNATLKEIEIPENAVFLVGDDWFRSNDSRGFGPISMESIKGKVLGEVSGSN
jgi:signal peptidase I